MADVHTLKLGWSGKVLAVLALVLFGGSALFAGLSEKGADAAVPTGYTESYTVKSYSPLYSSFAHSVQHNSSGDVLMLSYYPTDGDTDCTNDGILAYVDGSQLSTYEVSTGDSTYCLLKYKIGKSLYVGSTSGQYSSVSVVSGPANVTGYGSSTYGYTTWNSWVSCPQAVAPQ